MTDIETIIGMAVCGGFILVIILMKDEITELFDSVKTNRRRKNLRYVPKPKDKKEGLIVAQTQGKHITKSTDARKGKYHPQAKPQVNDDATEVPQAKADNEKYKRTTVWLRSSTMQGINDYLNGQCALRTKEGKKEVDVYLDEAMGELIKLYNLNAALIGNASAKILVEEMQKMVDANEKGAGKP